MAPLSLISVYIKSTVFVHPPQGANFYGSLVLNPCVPWRSNSRCSHPFRFPVDWIGAAVAPQICTSHLYMHFMFRSLTLHYPLHSPSCHQARLVRRFRTHQSMYPRITLKWFGQVLKAQNSSVHVQIIWGPQKSTEVNCQFNYGFGGGKWLEMPHSCSNKSHLTFQTSTL